VKSLAIFACISVAAGIAGATTVVVVTPSCTSSPHIVIGVKRQTKAANDVRLDIYQKIKNGEAFYWTGFTDVNGEVNPPDLPPGKYRVFADAGKEAGGMILLVDYDQAATKCEMKLGPLAVPETLDAMAAAAPSIHLSKFEGIVQDELGAVIPRLNVEVRKKENPDEGPVAEVQSSQIGRFNLNLENGSYVAVFSLRGFRQRVLAFDIGNDGWPGVRVTMAVGGGMTHDPPPEEWNPGTGSNAQTH
jgi:hypothetical protein